MVEIVTEQIIIALRAFILQLFSSDCDVVTVSSGYYPLILMCILFLLSTELDCTHHTARIVNLTDVWDDDGYNDDDDDV